MIIGEPHLPGDQLKELYLVRVNHLFDEVNTWLQNEPLQIEPHEIEIGEELTGDYLVPVLTISSVTPPEKLADLKPAGACIIAAEGRIDVEGWLGTEYLAYLIDGGPRVGGGRKLYEAVKDDGWYWIENNSSRRVHTVNKDILLQLLTEVSHYGFWPAR
jgi:hypothetical protein